MGGVASAAVRMAYPSAALVDHLSIILMPDECDEVVDGLDELSRRALYSPVAAANRRIMVAKGAVELCRKMLELCVRDEVAVRVAMRLLSRLTLSEEGAMQLADRRGEEAIKAVLDRYGDEADMARLCRKTLQNMDTLGERPALVPSGKTVSNIPRRF
eukprot:scaffold3319_cov258-Pinguiococcus_pyrenoidosus.AAC.10